MTTKKTPKKPEPKKPGKEYWVREMAAPILSRVVWEVGAVSFHKKAHLLTSMVAPLFAPKTRPNGGDCAWQCDTCLSSSSHRHRKMMPLSDVPHPFLSRYTLTTTQEGERNGL